MIIVTGKLPDFYKEWVDNSPSPLSYLEMVCAAISEGKPVFFVNPQKIVVIDGEETIRFEGEEQEMCPVYNAVQYVSCRLLDLPSAIEQLAALEEAYEEKGRICFQHMLAIEALLAGAKTPVEDEEEVAFIEDNLTFLQSIALMRLTAEGMKIAEAMDLVKQHKGLLNTDSLVLVAGKAAEYYGLKHTYMLRRLFAIVDGQLLPPKFNLKILPYVVALSEDTHRTTDREEIQGLFILSGVPEYNSLAAAEKMLKKGWSLPNFLEVLKEGTALKNQEGSH